MKLSYKSLIVAALCLLPVSSTFAESKVGIINLQKVFDGFWKTAKADVEIKSRAGEFDKQHKELYDAFQKANDEYKKLLDSANEQAISTEEKEKRKKSAETKFREIQEAETQLGQFDRTARSTLNSQQIRMREGILKDIQEVVVTKAKASSFSLVIDTAAQTVNNTTVVLYTNGDNDITDDVLKQLNIGAPAEYLKKTIEPAKADSLAPDIRISPGESDAKKKK